MKAQDKILQINSNLSKLIDSLCFQLSVNFPDENSLSLLEIIEWRKNGDISQQEFKELYCGWLQSKNIFDLFTAKQIKTYPKEQLLQYQGPIKKILTNKEITKVLEILNNAYNQLYIEKRVKGIPSASPKNQIKSIEEVEQLFSFLDNEGIISLRLNELFFLTAAILICQNKPIPSDFDLFREPFRKILNDLSQVNGSVSLRSFKNYFLVHKNKPLLIKTLNSVLIEIQNLSAFANEGKSKQSELPNIFEESLEKWKSNSRFRNKQKRIDFMKRVFEQNQRLLLFHDQIDSSGIQEQLSSKYGKDLMGCLQLDESLLEQFIQILEDTLNKYINLFQKLNSTSNKGKTQKTQYINSSTDLGAKDFTNSIQNSTNKKKMQSSIMESGMKNVSKLALKDRTPQKKRKNNNEFTASNNYTPSNNYRNRTPTHNSRSEIHGVYKQFGSAEKHTNGSGYGKTVRQTTPTKSTLSFLTEAPRTYRAAQKRGLTQNNIYDKLFFFRNKRVQSYEIVMKRLKNK